MWRNVALSVKAQRRKTGWLRETIAATSIGCHFRKKCPGRKVAVASLRELTGRNRSFLVNSRGADVFPLPYSFFRLIPTFFRWFISLAVRDVAQLPYTQYYDVLYTQNYYIRTSMSIHTIIQRAVVPYHDEQLTSLVNQIGPLDRSIDCGARILVF